MALLITNCGSQNWSSQLHLLKPIEPVWKQFLKIPPVWATLLMQFICQFCSLTYRKMGHCWKMVTHCLVRATIPGQRESSSSWYHIRSSLQGPWCWLLLQKRLSQILLCVLCLSWRFTVLVPTDHLPHPFCRLTCLWAVTTGRRHFKTLFIKPILGTSLTNMQFTLQKRSNVLPLRSWRHHIKLFL